MDTFEYEILTGRDQPNVPGGVVWFLASNTTQPLGFQLPQILNQLGAQGWDVAGMGDLAFGARVEIVLKRRVANA